MSQLENFERAFDDHSGSCRRTCACGVEYFDAVQSYSWEDGELEKLRSDPNAKGLEYAVSFVEFEGQSFVIDCKCWHPRAKRVIRFLESHAHQIKEFFSLEKKRKIAEAEDAAEIE